MVLPHPLGEVARAAAVVPGNENDDRRTQRSRGGCSCEVVAVDRVQSRILADPPQARPATPGWRTPISWSTPPAPGCCLRPTHSVRRRVWYCQASDASWAGEKSPGRLRLGRPRSRARPEPSQRSPGQRFLIRSPGLGPCQSGSRRARPRLFAPRRAKLGGRSAGNPASRWACLCARLWRRR